MIRIANLIGVIEAIGDVLGVFKGFLSVHACYLVISKAEIRHSGYFVFAAGRVCCDNIPGGLGFGMNNLGSDFGVFHLLSLS